MLNNFLMWIDAQPPWAVELAIMLWIAAMFVLIHVIMNRREDRDVRHKRR